MTIADKTESLKLTLEKVIAQISQAIIASNINNNHVEDNKNNKHYDSIGGNFSITVISSLLSSLLSLS